jgi:hypothetical protein
MQSPSPSRDPATSIQSLKYENRYRVSLQKAGILKRNGSGPRPLVGVIGNLAAEVCLHSFYGRMPFLAAHAGAALESRLRSGAPAGIAAAHGLCSGQMCGCLDIILGWGVRSLPCLLWARLV